MAEGPKIMRSDDGLFVRYEFDAHYISDEDAKRIRGYIDQLQAENDKLRELVQKMMRFMEDGDWCITCEVAKECDAQECEEQEQYEEDCLMRGVFHARMRELGVEVGG